VEWDEALAAATLYARVGKGTYIRTLAEDLGAALGVPAHIDRLRRLAIGPFSVEKARTLAEWEEAGAQGREWLLPPDALVADLPRVELDATRTLAFLAGQRIARAALGDSRSSGMVRVYGAREEGIPIFIGLGECDPARGLSPKRVIANITPPSSRVPVIPAE
jgi:tRNA pseudouridine55 synthase